MAKPDRASDKKCEPSSSARHGSRIASVGATRALIKAWAEKYEQRDRRSLSLEEWREISVAVDSRDKGRWTAERCKNRIRNVKTKYKKEKAAGSSSWVFFKRLDELLGPASDAEDVSDPWELDEAVTKAAGPLAELAQKLRGLEARMRELTGRGSDELVQDLARLEQAWSGFAASAAAAAVAENDGNTTEEDLGAENGPRDRDEPDGAAGRQTEQLNQNAAARDQDDHDGAAGRQTEQPNPTAERGSLKIRIRLRPRPRIE